MSERERDRRDRIVRRVLLGALAAHVLSLLLVLNVVYTDYVYAQTVPNPTMGGGGGGVATSVTPTRTAVTAAGGAFTCDFTSGPQNTCAVTLLSGAQTATVSGTVAGGRYLIEVIQPAAGAAGTVTWPATVHWPGAVAPTLTTTNSQEDIVVLVRNVSSLLGESGLNYVQ